VDVESGKYTSRLYNGRYYKTSVELQNFSGKLQTVSAGIV